MSEEKEWEIRFTPGCFDSFDGTQEELDELIAELKEMVTSGRIFEDGTDRGRRRARLVGV